MATTFKIEVLAEKVTAEVKALQRKSQDSTKVFETIGRVLVNRIRLGFRAGRSPKGVPWAPLVSREGRPLMDKRRLLRSILPKAGNGFVEVGTNLKVPGGSASLGAVHQYGAEIKPKNAKFLAFRIGGRLVLAKQVTIPARPFMPLSLTGQIDLPPAWSKGILRELGNYFGFGKVTA